MPASSVQPVPGHIDSAKNPNNDVVMMSGILTKRGSQFPFTWKQRYFTLASDRAAVARHFGPNARVLQYYECEAAAAESSKPRGTVTVVGVRRREEDPSNGLGLSFELESGAEMLIRCPTPEEQARWLLALSPEEAATGLAEERVSTLRIKKALTVAPDNVEPDVVEMLRQIWGTVGDSVSEMPFAPTGSQWGEVGFQGLDPASDFRGGGRLSVENLHYLATKHTAESRASLQLMAERGETPDGVPRNFPWACGSINVTGMLASFFVDEALGVPLWPAALALHDSSFDELHSVAFLLLVKYFVEMPGATYFDFNRVLHSCKERFSGMLKAHRFPLSVNELTTIRQGPGPQPLMEGWMVKLARHGPGKAMGRKTRRWFVLSERSLCFFRDGSLSIEKGRMDFTDSSAVDRPAAGHLFVPPVPGKSTFKHSGMTGSFTTKLVLKHNQSIRAMQLKSANDGISLFAEDRNSFDNWKSHLHRLVTDCAGESDHWAQEEISRLHPDITAWTQSVHRPRGPAGDRGDADGERSQDSDVDTPRGVYDSERQSERAEDSADPPRGMGSLMQEPSHGEIPASRRSLEVARGAMEARQERLGSQEASALEGALEGALSGRPSLAAAPAPA